MAYPVRVIAIADPHCGHEGGLTPPPYQYPMDTVQYDIKKKALIQYETWKWFSERIEAARPFDSLIINGDAIDGKGKKNGGNEQITTDRVEQCNIAVDVIKYINAKNVHMTYGTPFHVGDEENWEDVIADSVGADIKAHGWWEDQGVIIDCKHKVGRSGIPYGKHTAPAKAATFNALAQERGLEPKANLLLRAHNHYHVFSGDKFRTVICMPCLQAWSDFGDLQCEGTTDYGFLVIDINDGGFTWKAELLDMLFMAAQPRQL